MLAAAWIQTVQLLWLPWLGISGDQYPRGNVFDS
jgi:hypothetical protein